MFQLLKLRKMKVNFCVEKKRDPASLHLTIVRPSLLHVAHLTFLQKQQQKEQKKKKKLI